MSDEAPRSISPEQDAGDGPTPPRTTDGATAPRVTLDKHPAAPAPRVTLDNYPTAPAPDAAPAPGPAGTSTEPADAVPAPGPVTAGTSTEPADAVPAPGGPYAPVRDAIPAALPDAAPAPGSVHDQQTLTSLPSAPPVPMPAGTPSAPWASPAASAAPVTYSAAYPSAPPVGPFAPASYPSPAHPFAPSAASGNAFAPPSGPAASGNPFAPPVSADGRYGGAETVPPPPIAPDGPGQVPYGYPGGAAAYGAYGYPGQPQPVYGGSYPVANGYGWPAVPPAPSDGMGTASLVLGILASIGFLMWPVAPILGILAIIFGAIGRGRARRGEATNPGVALAGIICGAAGIVLVLGLFAFVIAFV
ncbi:DUF4190 domain-containing protein [Streptomyces sp. NPDC048514]|uniref:DUF4190 domain-containing protein n=1 Tax=Streptomyces sp. NPDC048514 TaxID=3365564 RepID=UPI00371EEFB5